MISFILIPFITVFPALFLMVLKKQNMPIRLLRYSDSGQIQIGGWERVANQRVPWCCSQPLLTTTLPPF